VGLIGGVLVVDLAIAGVGYALLLPALASLPTRVWISFAGVALLTGAAVVIVVLCVAAALGAHADLAAFALISCTAAAVGICLRFALPARIRAQLAPPRVVTPREGRRAEALATAAAVGVAIVLVTAVVGGFRTTPWLDDSWFMWLPKGLALDRLGLDARLFVPNPHYATFASPDYPWWWSILANIETRVIGSVDLRALNAELAILLAAFVAAAARLAWGRVRPSLLWSGLFLLTIAPELLRQTQGGGADVVLAVYLGLAAITGALWLVEDCPLWLGLAGVCAAAAAQIKNEGIPQLVIVLAVLSGFLGRRAGARRLASLWGAGGAALLLALPWLLWRRSNHIPTELSLGQGLHRLAALDARDHLSAAARVLFSDAFSTRQWLVLVPLAAALSIATALAARRLLPLAVVAFLGLEFAFWLWVYWATGNELNYRLSTSAYRVVVTPIVLAALAIPLLGETLLRAIRGRRGRAVW
jgi:hypothetical protein